MKILGFTISQGSVSLITCPFLGGKTHISSGQEEEMLGLHAFA